MANDLLKLAEQLGWPVVVVALVGLLIWRVAAWHTALNMMQKQMVTRLDLEQLVAKLRESLDDRYVLRREWKGE